MGKQIQWQPDQIRLLRDMFNRLLTKREMSIELGLPTTAIRHMLHKIGLRRITPLAHNTEIGLKLVKLLTQLELAYIAGIIDGEGHVSISRRMPNLLKSGEKSPVYCAYISICNTDAKLMYFLRDKLGSPLTLRRPGGNRRDQLYIRLPQRVACFLLERCYKYLIAKKDQFEIVARLRGTYKEYRAPRITPDHINNIRDECFQSIRAAHHKELSVCTLEAA